MPISPHNPPPRTPLSRRWLGVFVVVSALAAGLTGPSPRETHAEAAPWAIPQHKEDAVLKWLGPLTDGAQLTPQWRVADVAIDPDRLRLRLLENQNEPGQWVSLRLDAQPPRLLLDVPSTVPAPIAEQVRQYAAALVLPGPFQTTHVEVRAPPLVPWTLLARAYLTLRFVSLLTALLAALWLARSLPRVLWLPYAGLTLVAALARLWLSPATFLHEFYHINESLAALGGQPGFFNGYAGPALYSALVDWWPGDPTWMFAVNGIASTLTVPAIARLAAAVWRDERAGLIAGLLIALSPLHLRWGAAEDQWILGAAWVALALAAWLDAIATDDPLAVLVAALAAVLAVQSRPELLPFPLVLPVLALASRPRWLLHWLRTPRAYLTLCAAAIALWPIGLLLLNRPPPPSSTLAYLSLWGNAIWRDSSWTPLPLQVLTVAALLVALVTRRWTALVVAAIAFIWTALPMLFYAAVGPFLQRTQLLSVALWLVVAAGAVAVLARQVTWRVWLPCLLALAGFALVERRHLVTDVDAQQQEWQFLRSTVAKLPSPLRLIAPAGDAKDLFPVALLPPGRAATVLAESDVVAGHPWPPPGPDLVYYQSMGCWFHQPDAKHIPPGLNPRCGAILAHYVAEPIAVASLPGGVGPMLISPRARDFEVGFFRLTASRSDGR